MTPKTAVIGTGVMGVGVPQALAQTEHEVVLLDLSLIRTARFYRKYLVFSDLGSVLGDNP